MTPEPEIVPMSTDDVRAAISAPHKIITMWLGKTAAIADAVAEALLHTDEPVTVVGASMEQATKQLAATKAADKAERQQRALRQMLAPSRTGKSFKKKKPPVTREQHRKDEKKARGKRKQQRQSKRGNR